MDINKKQRITRFILIVVMVLASPFLLKGLYDITALNKSLSFDFSQSPEYTVDFTNSHFPFPGYDTTTVKYISGTSNYTASVRVTLYIDENGDGNYTVTEHSQVIQPEQGLISYLPYKRDVKRYRIVFYRVDQTLTAGTFSLFGGQPLVPLW